MRTREQIIEDAIAEYDRMAAQHRERAAAATDPTVKAGHLGTARWADLQRCKLFAALEEAEEIR